MAKEIGAKLVKNSGRGMNKGDMLLGNLVIDLKEVKKSFSVNMKVWAKVCQDASYYGWEHVPALLLSYPNGTKLMVMEYNDWRQGWSQKDWSKER